MDREGELVAAIEMRGLSRSFGGVLAVDGIDLQVEQGELFSLLGPNGAGKTTTIKMLCCLLRPTAGTATVMGHDVIVEPVAVKRHIAVSPQETAIAEHLDAWENLVLMAGLHGVDKREATTRASELLAAIGLTERASDRAKKYSGGMKRRLSVAMALVSKPSVLFLDEPTIGLDPQSRHAMWEYIRGLKGETTVMLTTHYLEEADALADRIAIVDDGKIVARGTPAELKRSVCGPAVTVIEAPDFTEEAVSALRDIYPSVSAIEGGVEIESDDVDLYLLDDCLRPLDVHVDQTYRRHPSLDDVFLELTGKQLRP